MLRRFLATIACLTLGCVCFLICDRASPAFLASPNQVTAPPLPTVISFAGKWKMHPGYLTPANLYLPTLDDSTWKEIQVPSNWFLQGEDRSGTVWFRHHFTPDSGLQGKVIKLVFEGVDYTADVWLNGQYLGFHEGYFQSFSFMVSEQLRFGEDNVLAVRVDSPYEEPGRTWSFHKRLLKGVLNHHDTRPGGAWSLKGQDQNTGGIWAPVYLRVSQVVSLDALQVTPHLPPEGTDAVAEVNVTLTYTDTEAKDVSFNLTLAPYNFLSEGITGGHLSETRRLTPGTHHLTFNVSCSQARLWWTWEHGAPNLYKLQVTVSRARIPFDTSQTTFGFRTIAYEPTTKVWHLNGQRIFLRGTNYIATQWLSEMSPEKYTFDLGLMKKAYINAVRVHAHIEAQAFYQLCDEAGILVWQDFLLQWGYTDDEAFITEAERQARDMIALLYNHPSIIAWSLHNEPPWDASWMQYKYPDYTPTHNRSLDNTLAERLSDADATRRLHPYSATSEHPWYGWYSGSWQDYGKPAREPLITEFGAQALPDLTSLRKIFSEEELWPESKEDWEKWEYHNFQKHETFDIAKVPQGQNIQEFIVNTQHYQAHLLKYAAESYRRQKFHPVTSIFQFMFVEDWPSINWGIVDYWRNLKPGYAALQTAYQPVLPSVAEDKDEWQAGEVVVLPVWVVNDLWTAFPQAQLVYTLRTAEHIVDQATVSTDIAPDSAQEIITLTKADLNPDHYELLVEVRNSEGRVLGSNQFQFTVEGESHE
ncbi:MAG TPA: glycoside hydrolase family 2 TIM barrel-domain containing protein [Candidatus Binatia bacterium]|nr:glycoside hydrolase family 2 TIM barrel-domain containing protein [Candidatus Binatia bacterium]